MIVLVPSSYIQKKKKTEHNMDGIFIIALVLIYYAFCLFDLNVLILYYKNSIVVL